jgi:glycosyltransferase involved in cell wall biosynthesis
MTLPPEQAARATILLSTYNGAAFLPEQLASFAGQHGVDWHLLWRDDGSADESVAVMQAFMPARCTRLPAVGNLGVLDSYMALLRAATPGLGPAECVAFADQDDVWLPEKSSRGIAALRAVEGPALYCSRLRIVDATLRPLGMSAPWRRPGNFPAALTQNIATGCTIMLNRAAARLVAASAPPPGTLHDWWSFLVVAAAGGALLRDETPSVLYRQHGGNTVGVAAGLAARAAAAARRGPRAFMQGFRAHVDALLARPELLAEASRRDLLRIEAALRAGPLARLRVLAALDLRRQTALEQAVFAAWFVAG